MNIERLAKIYYGVEENDYISSYLKEEDVLYGTLSESKAFELFFSDMVMCNNYVKNNYDNLNELVSAYNEEEDYYKDEFQFFIVEPEFCDEDMTIAAVEHMGNTLYYDRENELYIMGVTDLGTSRRIVPTDLVVKFE